MCIWPSNHGTGDGAWILAVVTAVAIDIADGTMVIVAIVGIVIPSRAADSPADAGNPDDTDHEPVQGLSNHVYYVLLLFLLPAYDNL